MRVITVSAIVFGIAYVAPASAQNWDVVFGMSQPLVLHGGNVEVNYLTEKWVFEYSHGFALNLNASPNEMALTDSERAQKLKITAPYSTGGGIGYRFTPAFNLRLELKQHEFRVTHPNGESIDYTVRDVGVGAYYFYHPFNHEHVLIVPSLRYWPTVDTSLNGDQHQFSNGDVHRAHNFGVFGNVSVGWLF